ncbi:N-acetylneuraminate synthase family protein [Candidatus Pelagibacter sp. Uisw_134_02]|uniref:N-acetylneuraminate synthase family protein n=1 Tax=Candidatus Pelagibacter sp. Uisw_134_02 TaxID=3230990 RepID=UPI0039ED362D
MKIKNFNINKKVFIIAEVGNNHEGSLKVAKKLVILAAKAGADAVKFQTFKTEDFVQKDDIKRFKQLKKFELSQKKFIVLKDLAHKNKIKFISTPLDLPSANFLIKNSDIIKIASGDNNFFPMIEKLLKSKKPLIISTGMMTLTDIKKLSRFINRFLTKKEAIKRIAFLHCVTSYPVENQYANLKSIPFLIKNCEFLVGYSDHTIGKDACLAAVAMGAQIIEKHFTLDKSFSNFRDHSLSADFKELESIVSSIRNIEQLKGKFEKKLQLPEKKNIKIVRRSAFAKCNIKINDKIDFSNTIFVRPAKSKNFSNLINLMGRKAKKKIKKNQKITNLKLY